MRKELTELVKKYTLLKILSPKNELLKYFSVDEKGLRINLDNETNDEFINRFIGKNVPEKRNMSNIDYSMELCRSLFRNYTSALEKAINLAKKMN